MNFQKVRPCLFCGEEKIIKAKGFCGACYKRYRERGTPEYIKIKKTCSIKGCSHISIGHGLCNTHYMRLKRHGNTSNTRPKGWGSKKKHPLYNTWSWNKRILRNGMCNEWSKDFWLFVSDVGEKPFHNSKIKSIDNEKELSPNNFEWVKYEVWPSEAIEKKKKANEYQRNYRKSKIGKIKIKDRYLKKHFGITIDDYQEILKKQNNVCCICGEKETEVNNKTKRTVDLSVDHCHTTNKIRGLLCAKCNQGIGCFKDSKDLLQRAIDYLI